MQINFLLPEITIRVFFFITKLNKTHIYHIFLNKIKVKCYFHLKLFEWTSFLKWNIAKSDQYICTEIKYKHTDVPCRFFFCISINCSDIQLFMCFSLLNWVRFPQKTLHLNKFIMNMIFSPRKWNIHKTQRFLVKRKTTKMRPVVM